MVYPADNALMFGGALVIHALLGGSLLEAEKNDHEKISDEVLADLSVLLTSVDRDVISKRIASRFEKDMNVKLLLEDHQELTSPTFTTQPFVAISQNKDFLLLSNFVEFSRPGGRVSYTNRVSAVSQRIDLARLAMEGETHKFFEALITIYVLTNAVAVLDASGKLTNETAKEATFKVGMGGAYQYHRARMVDVVDGYGVLKVLGGNLLLAPLEQISQ